MNSCLLQACRGYFTNQSNENTVKKYLCSVNFINIFLNMPTPFVVYSPQSSVRKPLLLLKGMLADIVSSNDLSLRLAIRDIKALYRQSFLGYLWAFLLPLLNTVTWLFLRSSGIVTLEDTGMPYSVFVVSGTMLWQIFAEAFQSPINEVSSAKGVMSKLNFPREAIIVSGIYKVFFNAAIKLVILVPIVFILGAQFSWQILLLPFAVILLIFLGITLGLLLTPLSVLYTDISKGLPIVTQFLMFLSPVVFAMPREGFTGVLFKYNFISPFIITARSWLTGTPNESLYYFLIVSTALFFFLFIAWIIYRISMPILVERMSS